MDFRWLQDFLSLAEAGNFNRAADARHSSQPAFSRRIQSLEAWLGVELIDRSRYPTVLTPAGERFRVHAAEMVRRMIDTRAELQGDPAANSDTITFAIPHTLATTRFPEWWKVWREAAGGANCRLLALNVHDAVTAMIAGLADVLICFHHAQQPIYLDQGQYDGVSLGTEWLRPYSSVRRGQPAYALPGTAKAPIPLLTYSSGAFLGRMASIILDSAGDKAHVHSVFESDMADALLAMATAGHGLAWLPDGTAAAAKAAGQLVSAGDDRWALPLTIYAYRDRAHATPVVNKLMSYLESRKQRDLTRHEPSLAGRARQAYGGRST
jgi:LysR family transcriptional regulator, hypochlorite-specific transcription factor HypT